MVAPKQQELFRTIAQGRAKVDGPLVKIGSFMAKKLSEKFGAERLLSYSTTGAIAFFDDYNKLDLPAGMKFNDTVVKHIAGWQQSWSKTNNAAVRMIAFNGDTDLDAVACTITQGVCRCRGLPEPKRPDDRNAGDPRAAGKPGQSYEDRRSFRRSLSGLDRTHAYKGLLLTISGEREKGERVFGAFDRTERQRACKPEQP